MPKSILIFCLFEILFNHLINHPKSIEKNDNSFLKFGPIEKYSCPLVLNDLFEREKYVKINSVVFSHYLLIRACYQIHSDMIIVQRHFDSFKKTLRKSDDPIGVILLDDLSKDRENITIDLNEERNNLNAFILSIRENMDMEIWKNIPRLIRY